jgi:peptidoglycan hydrolase-like protein with peptidoglycan-binding domain
LKELSAAVDTTLLEKVVTRSDPENSQRPAKERTLSAVGIKQLQQLLKKLDLEPGPADGVLGNKTKEAIRLYQRFAGLPVDGKPTFDLLLDLRQVVDAMSADKPAGVGGR